ncbi:hypothetical protein GTS_17470 [Gandjariella thermophila]|uniref:Uncharacterized protein n=1 Tax=Gandjariella thermophila TaxID=1931992 RepID=A0A4D4J3S5_9PSEU|nr:hypothetical protein GTS_17470 [Gandjariella thermophila]
MRSRPYIGAGSNRSPRTAGKGHSTGGDIAAPPPAVIVSIAGAMVAAVARCPIGARFGSLFQDRTDLR